MLRNSSGGVSLESYLAPSGVPMDDVGVQFEFELFVRVELPASVELVLQMAEHLLGGGVVQAVALAAHGLADAEAFELVPPPLVLVPPSHVRVQDRLRAGGQALREHGEQTLLLPEVRTAAHVPGDDLLAGHVVHGREVRLGAGDLELGDVGAELGERTGRVEVAFGQVMHVIARLAPVRAVPPPRVPGADGASQSHAPHDPEHALGRHSLPELVDQTHAHLSVAAPVRRASPDLADQWLEIGPRHTFRMRQLIEVRGSGQSRYPQEVVEPVSPPCEQSDDGASLAPRDLDARRARSFSRYATFAFRYATCSASSCSRVGSGFGLSASGPVVAAPALQGRDARDPVPGHGLRLGQTVLDVVARRGDLRLPVVASAAAASHDRLLAVGPVQPDPVSRGIHRYGKPAGKRVLAGSGLDELQRLAPEPVVVTSPSILTHTKEPHLRSSNLNFFSPTIGVRFITRRDSSGA